jgi:hypothetical protein
VRRQRVHRLIDPREATEGQISRDLGQRTQRQMRVDDERIKRYLDRPKAVRVLKDSSLALDEALTLDFTGAGVSVSQSSDDGVVVTIPQPAWQTFGPFYGINLAANATTALQAGFWDGAAMNFTTMDVFIPANGEIVGLEMIANGNRTGGSATLRATVNGVQQTFDGGAECVIDASNTRRHAIIVANGDGEDVSAGSRVGLEVVTSSFGPVNTDILAWFTVRLDR